MDSPSAGSEDILNCPICLEQYEIPRALPCLHTFCEKCLMNWIKHNSVQNTLTIGSHRCFPCPVCKDDVNVPPEGIKGFRHNFYVANAIEPCSPKRSMSKEADVDKSMACNRCDEMGVIQMCIKCNTWMCPLCCEDHKRVKGTKSHILATNMDMCEANLGDALCDDDLSTCSIASHTKLSSNFCTNCKTLVCDDCQKDKHSSHGVISVLCKISEVTEQLHECLCRLQRRSEAMEKQQATLKSAKKELVAQGHRTLKEFDQSYAAVQKAIQDMRSNLLKNLKKQITEQVKTIDEKITGINNKLAVEHSVEEEMKGVLAKSNRQEILTQSDFLLQQGEQCLNAHLLTLENLVTVSSPHWKPCEEDLFNQLLTKLLGSCEYSAIEINLNKRIKKKAKRSIYVNREFMGKQGDNCDKGFFQTKVDKTNRLIDIIRDFDPFASSSPNQSEESESNDGAVAENDDETLENVAQYLYEVEADSESPPSDPESDQNLLIACTPPPPPPGPFYEDAANAEDAAQWWPDPPPHHPHDYPPPFGGPPPWGPPPPHHHRGRHHPPPFHHPRMSLRHFSQGLNNWGQFPFMVDQRDQRESPKHRSGSQHKGHHRRNKHRPSMQ